MLHKKMRLTVVYTQNILIILKFLKKIKYINFFYISKTKKNFIEIYPFYYKNLLNWHQLKIMAKPTQTFAISLHALRLIKKRTDAFYVLLSTSQGLMTHSEAIRKQTAGHVFGYLCV